MSNTYYVDDGRISFLQDYLQEQAAQEWEARGGGDTLAINVGQGDEPDSVSHWLDWQD